MGKILDDIRAESVSIARRIWAQGGANIERRIDDAIFERWPIDGYAAAKENAILWLDAICRLSPQEQTFLKDRIRRISQKGGK